MNKAKHTPYISAPDTIGCPAIYDNDGRLVGRFQTVEDADFIADAANNHDELVRLADKIDEEWHLAHDALKAGDRDQLFIYLCSWQDTARAALAKLKDA